MVTFRFVSFRFVSFCLMPVARSTAKRSNRQGLRQDIMISTRSSLLSFLDPLIALEALLEE